MSSCVFPFWGEHFLHLVLFVFDLVKNVGIRLPSCLLVPCGQGLGLDTDPVFCHFVRNRVIVKVIPQFAHRD